MILSSLKTKNVGVKTMFQYKSCENSVESVEFESSSADLAAQLYASCTHHLSQEAGAIWLLFHRKLINFTLKHSEIWKHGQFKC